MFTVWGVPVILRIFIGHVIAPILIKQVAGQHSRLKRFLLQYVFCSVIAIVSVVALGGFAADWLFLGIVSLGFINGLAAYCQWRAMDISLSRNSIFTWADDVIAMLLSYYLMSEGRFITLQIGVGIACSFAAVVLMMVHGVRKKREGMEAVPLKLYGFIAIYSVTWGVATFLMRYFAVGNVPVLKFLPGWYIGALVAALFLFLFYKEGNAVGKTITPFSAKDKAVIFLLSSITVGSLALNYWAFALAPLVIVQPIFLVSEMILPSLIGLWFFKEYKQFDGFEWGYFALGIAGALTIVLGF